MKATVSMLWEDREAEKLLSEWEAVIADGHLHNWTQDYHIELRSSLLEKIAAGITEGY